MWPKWKKLRDTATTEAGRLGGLGRPTFLAFMLMQLRVITEKIGKLFRAYNER